MGLDKNEILMNAKIFFKESIIENHIANTKKLIKLKEFNVNPFLAIYLANYLTGEVNSRSIAKALIYPRVLGSSITTSFGTHLQNFCSRVLTGYGSTAQGIDVEFIDAIDGRKKYCQIKAGPNTINKDDIKTIMDHFKGVRNLARTNNTKIDISDLIVGVFYGTKEELSQHYKKIDEEYPVYVGQEFWYRITGNENFYYDLIEAIVEVSEEIEKKGENEKDLLDDVIDELSKEIEKSTIFKEYLNKKNQRMSTN